MTEKVQNIAKNTSYFTLALVIQKFLTFVYFAILARILVPEELGKYYLAMSFALIFVTLIDFGQTTILTREVAKDKENIKDLISSVMGIKIPLMLFSALAVFSVANILNYEEFTKNLIYLSIIVMIFDSLGSTFFSIIRGFHNLFYESIASVVMQIIVMVFGLFWLYNGKSIYFLMIAMIFGVSFKFSLSWILLTFKWKISLKPSFNIKRIRAIIYLTLPFALYGIFLKIQSHVDTIMLSKLAGDYYTGIYQIAFKIVFALQFLPIAFTASLYPAFATYYKNKNEQLNISFERGFNYLLIISLPIVFGVIAIADKIILIFKPEYLPAVPVMQIAILALPFLFLIYPLGAMLNACDKQIVNTRNMAFALIVGIVLNYTFILKYQALGASIAIALTNLFLFFIDLFTVKNIIKINLKKITITFFKTFISAFLMAMIVFYIKDFINILLAILIGAIIYFSLLLSLKIIRKEDVLNIIKSFKK